MSLQILEVNNKDLNEAFIDLQWHLYKDDPNWVPQLKMALNDLFKPNHPFYKTAKMKRWLAVKDGRPVGRIAAVINNYHNDYQKEKTGFFGFFESIDDPEVSKALFDKAESYLISMGMEKVRGPMNPSTNYDCGLLVDGYDDPPQLMMPYNHAYYQNHFEEIGLDKSMDLLAYRRDPRVHLSDRMVNLIPRLEKRGKVSYRYISKKHWDRDIALMREIYNGAWESNWGFVPMTEEEFNHTAKDLKSVVEERLIIFVLVDGKEVGFIVSLPDYNQVFKKIPNGKLFPFGIFKLLFGKKHINRVRVITMGVLPKYRRLGLDILLYKKTQDVLREMNIGEAELSWVLENNEMMNRPINLMKADPYKRYRIYEKQLQ